LVDIKVPIFVDKNTVLPEGTSAPLSNGHVGEPLLNLPKIGRVLMFKFQPNPVPLTHISKWTPWLSAWDVVVSKSLSKLGMSTRRGGSMMLSCLWLLSWYASLSGIRRRNETDV
jgi:hypothetical protein